MQKWIVPSIVAFVLLTVTDQFGLQQDAWWLIPTFLFPIAIAAMIVRRELTIGSVAMLVCLSAVLALILKLTP